MSDMSEKKKVPVGVSNYSAVNVRRYYENVVLYIDVQRLHPDCGLCGRFVAEVHEASAVDFDPEGPGFKNPIFRSIGEGFYQCKAALSCLNQLYADGQISRLKECVAQWLLSCPYSEGGTYQLCVQLCNEGLYPNLSLSALRPPDVCTFRGVTTLVYTDANQEVIGWIRNDIDNGIPF
jgi:hypothetical protein